MRRLDRFPRRVGHLIWRVSCAHTDRDRADYSGSIEVRAFSTLRELSWVWIRISLPSTTITSDDGSSGLCGYPTLE